MIATLAVVAALYGPAQNPAHAVDRISTTLGDLPVRLSFPKGATGKLPVLVFSHGMYGSCDSYDPLVDAVAGNGYLVVQMSHADSATRMSAADRLALLRNPNTNQTQNWRERPGEVSRCIDHLEELAAKAKVQVDVKRVAVGGHSYGAWTTQCLAGMEISGAGQTVNFLDPRPRAYVVLSPHGPGRSVTEASLGKMRGPMLMVTGSKDDSPRGETAAWRRKAFELAPAGNKMLVWIEGAAHDFGGLTGERSEAVRRFMARAGASVSQDPDHVAIAKSAVVSFLDAYVKEDPQALAYCQEKRIAELGKVSVEVK